jgi:hypothetical protein
MHKLNGPYRNHTTATWLWYTELYFSSGYISTEYAMEGIFSVKSDVYGFGVLILSFHCHEDSLNIAGYVNTDGY